MVSSGPRMFRGRSSIASNTLRTKAVMVMPSLSLRPRARKRTLTPPKNVRIEKERELYAIEARGHESGDPLRWVGNERVVGHQSREVERCSAYRQRTESGADERFQSRNHRQHGSRRHDAHSP